MKKICFAISVFIIVSCGKEKSNNEAENVKIVEKIEYFKEFDDTKEITELFELPEFEKLSIDNNYKEYIADYWDTNKSMNVKFFEQNELNADVAITDKKMSESSKNDPIAQADKAKTLAKITGKAISSIFSIGKDAYGMIKLEKKKKELDDSFSKEKKDLAQKFEKQLNSILDYSCKFPINEKVRKSDDLINYKSIGESLKDDDEVMDYLEPLIKQMDQFLILGIDLKTKIKLNKIAKPTFDSSQFVEYGNNVINANGDFNINLNSNYLNDYFKKLNEVVKQLKEQNFKIPVEDWSENKKQNFNFIITDIRTKLTNEINALNN